MKKCKEPSSNVVTMAFDSVDVAELFIGWYLDGGGDEAFSESLDDIGIEDWPHVRVRCGDYDWPGGE